MFDGFIKVACATPEIVVADCAHNTQKTIHLMKEAAAAGIKLLVFPELGLTGYTCGDLFFQSALLKAVECALLEIMDASENMDMITVVGIPFANNHKLYNCAAVVSDGRLLGLVPKTHLPNYNEFYERRQFTPAPDGTELVAFNGDTIPFGTDLLFSCSDIPEFTFACEICEDLWAPCPPSIRHTLAGATVIANLSASDELVGKAAYRRALVAGQSARLVCAYLYSDAGEGESTTDMTFAAHNLIAENGTVLKESRYQTDELLITEIDVQRLAAERRKMTTYPAADDGSHLTVSFSLTSAKTSLTRFVPCTPFIPASQNDREAVCEDILAIQTAGLKKRLSHSRAKTAVVGISGGLDSALALLVCARAMDALGRPRTDIHAVTMPCFGTTPRTRSNAQTLCEELGVTFSCVDIKKAVDQHFADIGHNPNQHDVTFENAQARERTQILMDIANQNGGLVVGTGDLSELALGWATYNGDHMSMYAVNASVPKTLVRYLVAYEAARFAPSALDEVLRDILDTPVSPELLPPNEGEIAQKTEDLVGPYELHDFFLYYGIRWAFSPAKVFRLACHAFNGIYQRPVILYWLETFYRRFFAQQFKRSCLPDGPKVGSASLSPRGDWRMPSDASAAMWQSEIELLKEAESSNKDIE